MGGMPCYPDCIKGHLYLYASESTDSTMAKKFLPVHVRLPTVPALSDQTTSWVGSYAMSRCGSCLCIMPAHAAVE